jgi:voltage-gated potassium channel
VRFATLRGPLRLKVGNLEGFAMNRPSRPTVAKLRHRLYGILEHGPIGDRVGRITGRAIVVLIVVNLAAVILESVPPYETQYRALFLALELVSLVAFTIEYALRVWVAVEHAPLRHLSNTAARLKFMASPFGLVDLLAVLPFWLAFVAPADLRVVLIFRIVRFLKLARYSPSMRSLLAALNGERRALFGCLVILLGATIVAASIMHLVEGGVQPKNFGTIPDAMWWAIVTLSTIGYGDVVPITGPGKLVAAVTGITGLVMMALPIGIVATAFANEVHRRDFVVTWSMVARVPVFSGLSAIEIADIMGLLRAQQFEAGEVVVRRGEAAHSMYFVAAGEVEIALNHERIRLGAGHFFGEIAALRRARRSATVTALTRTSLLVLDAHDLRALMDRQPRIAERIRDVARKRLEQRAPNAKGDLLTEELLDTDAPADPDGALHGL